MAGKQALDIAGYVERISALINRMMLDPLHSQIPEDLSDLELTIPQYQCLLFVMQHDGCSVGDMASGLSISHPAAVKMVDRLQKKDLLRKTESEDDRRISLLHLTESGSQVTARIHSERLGFLSRSLSRMTQAEIEGLIRGLEALLESALDNEDLVKAVCLRCGKSHMGCCVVNRSSVVITGSGIEKP